ncbi:MAG: hypothetical protein ABIB46_04060 [bacterium]
MKKKPELSLHTFCYNDNKLKQIFRVDLPNGNYQVEIGSGKGGNYQGNTLLNIQNGQHICEYSKLDGKKSVLVFNKKIKVDNGFLQIEMGYENDKYEKKDKKYEDCSIINYLKIYKNEE